MSFYIRCIFKHAGDICGNVVDVTRWPVFSTASPKSTYQFFRILDSQLNTIARSVSSRHSEVEVLIWYHCCVVEQSSVDMEVLASYTSLEVRATLPWYGSPACLCSGTPCGLWYFLYRCTKNTQMSNFMKSRAIGVDMFLAYERTDRQTWQS